MTWVPVTERLPDKGQTVLCFKMSEAGNHYYKVAFYDHASTLWVHSSSYAFRPSHWMELPEGPKQ